MHSAALKKPFLLRAGSTTLPVERACTTVSRPRCHELDMIRGLCFFVMLSDHLLGNPLQVLTSKPLGLFTAADAFVLISGITAGMKYQKLQATQGMAKVWISILRSLLVTFVMYTVIRTWSNLGSILHLYLCLWSSIGVLAFICARGGRKWVLAGSVLCWGAAFVVPLPPPLNHFGFNPFSWQLVFTLGFLFGHRKARGAAPLPWNRTLAWASCVVAGALFCLQHAFVVPQTWWFVGHPCVGPLRILDFLAVAYLCYHLVHAPAGVVRLCAAVGRKGVWMFLRITVLVAAWEYFQFPGGPALVRAVVAPIVLAALWLPVPALETLTARKRAPQARRRASGRVRVAA